ncbi:MAG TPA: hypothetical protein VK811_01970 [Candidatus Acidoferrum sp.]|jgi:hypothetical protein|nr:hypothetical protein [Candidatus Acidoferrum sp.]
MPQRFLTLTCAVVGFIHFAQSGFKADYILIWLIVLCFIPWMGNVFESIGKDGAKFRTKSGTSVDTSDESAKSEDGFKFVKPGAKFEFFLKPKEPVKPPAAEKQLSQLKDEIGFSHTFAQLPYEEKKILATLWRFQKSSFPIDSANRWTFAVGPLAPDYPAFSLGYLGLNAKGLVTLSPESQVMLTGLGMHFCKENTSMVMQWADIYDKFGN